MSTFFGAGRLFSSKESNFTQQSVSGKRMIIDLIWASEKAGIDYLANIVWELEDFFFSKKSMFTQQYV